MGGGCERGVSDRGGYTLTLGEKEITGRRGNDTCVPCCMRVVLHNRWRRSRRRLERWTGDWDGSGRRGGSKRRLGRRGGSIGPRGRPVGVVCGLAGRRRRLGPCVHWGLMGELICQDLHQCLEMRSLSKRGQLNADGHED